MPFEVEKSVRSSRDIEEAFVFIAENNLDRGVYFLVAIEDSLSLLAENPFMGHERPFKNSRLSGLRVWRVKGFHNYVLIYLVDEEAKELRLMRLVNSKRDFDKIEI